MKKRYLLIGFIIISLCVFTIFCVDNKKSFVKDGIIFAVTLDGEVIDHFPEQGKYGVLVSCGNANGTWLSDEWKFVIKDIKGNVSCNLDFSTSPKTLINIVEENALSKNNGHRYNGVNPNNFIWFNNELWRIIGSVPTKNENGTTENLVKILRHDSIGGVSYNTQNEGSLGSYTHLWGENTLYKLLNEYYYGKKDGTNTKYCFAYGFSGRSKCDYTNIGLSNSSFYGKMLKNVYWNVGRIENYNNLLVDEIYDYEISNQSTQGYVGIINVSDYGYAADSNFYNTAVYRYYKEATKSNWIYKYAPIRTMNGYTGASDMLSIQNDGSLNYTAMYYGELVHPVVYLDSSVYVVSGSGTEANPYQIAM